MMVVMLVAPLALALALPTAPEGRAPSEEDEELTPLFELPANDSDAENGTIRVFLNPGFGLHPQQSIGSYPYPQPPIGSYPYPQQPIGAYPYPQQSGIVHFPNSQQSPYPGTGFYPYLKDCSYWCARGGSYSREFYCCGE